MKIKVGILFLILLLSIGCSKDNKTQNNDKINDKDKITDMKKLTLRLIDEALSRSKSETISRAGKIGLVSKVISFLEIAKLNSEKQYIEQLLKKEINKIIKFEQMVSDSLKHKVDIAEVIFKNTDQKGYFGHNNEEQFGYSIMELNKDIILSSNEFQVLLLYIMSLNTFDRKQFFDSNQQIKIRHQANPQKINDDISILYDMYEDKYAVIYGDGYYKWFHNGFIHDARAFNTNSD